METSGEFPATIEDLVGWIANRLAAGATRAEISADLVLAGFGVLDAKAVVDTTADHLQAMRRRAAMRSIGIGVVIAVVGALVTWGSYTAADPGDRYLVAWGAIAFGGLQALVGCFRLLGAGMS